MDGQQTRPLVYAGSYTACCEGGGRPLVGALHNIIFYIILQVLSKKIETPLLDENIALWTKVQKTGKDSGTSDNRRPNF